MELVLGDGSVRHLSAATDPELLRAARVGVGELGVVTAVTLRCVPPFRLHGIDRPEPLEDVLDSLDARAASTDDDPPLIRTLGGDDAGFDRVEDHDAVREAMARLPVRQREILRLRFDEELTQSQIGEELGISQMHVSRLTRDALTKLREPLAETYATG